MLDQDLSVYLWLAFVFFGCGCVGFIVGLQLGDHYQRQVAQGIARLVSTSLAEIHTTLIEVRRNGKGQPAPGFQYSGPTNHEPIPVTIEGGEGRGSTAPAKRGASGTDHGGGAGDPAAPLP